MLQCSFTKPVIHEERGKFIGLKSAEWEQAASFWMRRSVCCWRTYPLDGSIVETFIARDGDPDFITGSWVVAVHVPDTDTWNLIKSGELNGFSLEGIGQKKTQNVTFQVPDLLKGETNTKTRIDEISERSPKKFALLRMLRP